MFIEYVGGHIPSTDPMSGPNDRIRKCDVIIQACLRIPLKRITLVTAAKNGQRNVV